MRIAQNNNGKYDVNFEFLEHKGVYILSAFVETTIPNPVELSNLTSLSSKAGELMPMNNHAFSAYRLEKNCKVLLDTLPTFVEKSSLGYSGFEPYH